MPLQGGLQELFGSDVIHCTAPYWRSFADSVSSLETLPFGDLGGRGLERLCFSLLVARGWEARFFGRNGDPDFAVDIIAVKDGRTELYQCKNCTKPPSQSQLQKWVDKFEEEWLGEQALSKPERFVICCPQPLVKTKEAAFWTRQEKEFYDRTGVGLGFWHHDLLNQYLKKYPDIVSDLFSDRHAVSFCDFDRWKPDVFCPLVEGASGDIRLRRYFSKKADGRLYVHPEYRNKMTEILESQPVMLVHGLPGTGKTFTALAIAEAFRESSWRTYFVDVSRPEINEAIICEGIEKRSSRPSIFILENCNENVDAVYSAQQRLEPVLKFETIKIICLSRRVPGEDESRSDDSQWFRNLEAASAMIQFTNSDHLMKEVIGFWRHEFKWLSKPRFQRLIALSGKDLYLLDELLNEITAPVELDTMPAGKLYDRIRLKYFGGKTAADLGGIRKLAALAQFEIAPRVDVLPITSSERETLEGLCIQSGRPPRWHFLHSSAAELILHALAAGMGITDSVEIAKWASADLNEYLNALLSPALMPRPSPTDLQKDIWCLLKNRLKLCDDSVEGTIKAGALGNAATVAILDNVKATTDYLSTLSLCAFIAEQTGADATLYAQRLFDEIRAFVSNPSSFEARRILQRLGLFLRTLKLVAPTLHSMLTRELDAKSILALIFSNATVVDLFRIVKDCPGEFAWEIVTSLDDKKAETLVNATVAAGSSIGTLHLTLRDLHGDSTRSIIGRRLESSMTAKNMLSLIQHNGTVVELLMTLQICSGEFAAELASALEDLDMDALIANTIKKKRSIGTLSLAFRGFQRDSTKSTISSTLETAIGAERMLALIKNNGSIVSLIKIMEAVSGEFAGALVAALDEPAVDSLLSKAMKSACSIGTINLALRDLHSDVSRRDVACRLEEAIGVNRILLLIQSNGCLFELLRIMQYASAGFANGIIASLTPAVVETLVRKTIVSNRSIGTFNITFRTLARRDKYAKTSQREQLERVIGVDAFLQLMIELGCFSDYVNLTQDFSPAFSKSFSDAVMNLDESSWRRILIRGDYFDFCRLVLDGHEGLPGSSATQILMKMMTEEAPALAARSSWYALNTSEKQLSLASPTPCRDAALEVLDAQLYKHDLTQLSFLSWVEAANALDLFFRRRPELRQTLARRILFILPSLEDWDLDPKKEMFAPRLVLYLLVQPEFDGIPEATAIYQHLAGMFNHELIQKCRTEDALWMLWHLFSFAHKRLSVSPTDFGQGVEPDTIKALHILIGRDAKQQKRAELRSRFALSGLLSYLGIEKEAAALSNLAGALDRQASCGAWWLTADQKFVFAFFILRGLNCIRTIPSSGFFSRRLISAAAEYTEIDATVELLLKDVINDGDRKL